jgi:hypothetical protein
MPIDLATLTAIHTALSLVALAAGPVVILNLLRSRPSRGWTGLFLVTAVATSATGFLFPFSGFLPSHGVGAVALAVLAATLAALYPFRLAGPWRAVYAAGIVASVYFNVFVAIAQAFLKIPPLHALAPTQAEPPFAIAQAVALALFVWLGILAVRRFSPALAGTPAAAR